MLILKGHKGPIYEIDFSPDGSKLVSAGRDGTVRLWDLFIGEQIHLLKIGSCVNTVSFSGDGRTIAAGGCENKIVLWNIAKDMVIQELAVVPPGEPVYEWVGTRVESLDFSPSGKELIAMASQKMACWHLKKVRWDLAWQGPGEGGCVACSPSGITFAAGGVRNSYDSWNAIEIWTIEAAKWKGFPDLIGRSGSRGSYAKCRTTSLVYSPDGKMLAGTCGRELVVWDAWNRRMKPFIFQSSRTHFQSAAFSPDGLALAAVNNDNTVRTWETTTWKPGNKYDWEIGKLLDIAYAPDGMRAAACSDTGKIIVWDIVT